MKMMIDDDVVVIRCPWSFFTELIPNSQFQNTNPTEHY